MRYAVFFRNIMLGRAGSPSRTQLLDALEAAGAVRAVSFQAHGNAAFDATDATAAKRILAATRERLRACCGWDDVACVRGMRALARQVASTPFAGISLEDVHERCVTFLPKRTASMPALPIHGARGDFEILAATADAVYSVTRLVGGRPGNVTGHLQRLLGMPLTTRNWNTVERLLERHG